MASTFEAAIPPLEAHAPDCPVCWNETCWEDGDFVCQHCGLCWSERLQGDRGSRLNDEPPCGAVPAVTVEKTSVPNFYRYYDACSLPAGHPDEDGHWHGARYEYGKADSDA